MLGPSLELFYLAKLAIASLVSPKRLLNEGALLEGLLFHRPKKKEVCALQKNWCCQMV